MIDKQAIVDVSAKIADDVYVGPFAQIGPNVEIASGSWVGSHVIIQQDTAIGRNNCIHPFATIGGDPQHLGYKGERTRLEVGENNIIREYCSLHRGTAQGHGVTKIGNNNFLMSYVHVAHDCVVGNGTILANNATLAGHVTIGDYAGLGGFSVILQFCNIGAYSFVAGTTGIGKDVPPFVLVSATHEAAAQPYGLNLVGLRRNGFKMEDIKVLKRAYSIIYREGLTVKQAIPMLEQLVNECKSVQLLIDALQNSKRGIVR